jgi:hypothetical protein
LRNWRRPPSTLEENEAERCVQQVLSAVPDEVLVKVLPYEVMGWDAPQVSVLQLALHRLCIARQFDVPVSAHGIAGVLADGFDCTFPVDEGRV